MPVKANNSTASYLKTLARCILVLVFLRIREGIFFHTYIMVKLLFLPKFDQQCARRIAHDSVAKGLLPMQKKVRIAICQDGRLPGFKTALQCEAEYFQTMYQKWNYLDRPDITVECYAFSFSDPPATLQQHLTDLVTTDIFFMTGFTPGQYISDNLKDVFKNHGKDERDRSCMVHKLIWAIQGRVQYNEMVYMGTCGGACCAGRRYWSRVHSGALGPTSREFELFDFCMGVSLH